MKEKYTHKMVSPDRDVYFYNEKTCNVYTKMGILAGKYEKSSLLKFWILKPIVDNAELENV